MGKRREAILRADRRVDVILRAGRTDEQLAALDSAVGRLRSDGDRVEVRTTARAGDAARLAGEAAEAGADRVVAAGGDGTVSEVVNGLARAGRRVPVGVVPLGTANDFAGGLGVPDDLGEALEVAVRGRVVNADLPLVNDRYFINVSTGGFGAEATEHAASDSKRLLGAGAYFITGAKQLVEMRVIEGVAEADGRVLLDGQFVLFAVGNARQTGGGSRLTPRAELDDGLLDLLVVRAVPRVDFLALLPDLRAGTHLDSPDVLYTQAKTISITTRQPIAVNADGEPIRGDRFVYRIDAEPMPIVVPGD